MIRQLKAKSADLRTVAGDIVVTDSDAERLTAQSLSGRVELNGERVEVEDRDRYALQLENFSLAVRGEAEPLLGREDALGQARAIEALYRSTATGAAVSL